MTVIEKNFVDEILETGCGYYQGLSFEPAELQQLLDFVHEQWLMKIKEKCPTHWKTFADAGITRYHEYAHYLDHESTWPKSSRMFSKNISQKIQQMSLMQSLEKIYGPIKIIDEENIGYEEFDWRLVRPNELSDVGPVHADSWFRLLGPGIHPPSHMKAIKIWVALCCEPGLNGLRVVPHSQKKQWRYHGEFRHGFVKPQIDENEDCLDLVLLKTPPGNVIVFHESLLHGGALNRGKYTRVSMEFMAFVNK